MMAQDILSRAAGAPFPFAAFLPLRHPVPKKGCTCPCHCACKAGMTSGRAI